MHLHRTLGALGCAAVLLLGTGCSAQNDSEASPTAETVEANATGSRAESDRVRSTMGAPEEESTGSLIATANDDEVDVHTKQGGKVTGTFENPTPTGVPLTFMVLDTTEDWVQVQLPVRPNGDTAWVEAEEVTLAEVAYSLEVSTDDKTLKLYRADQLVDTFEVATGTGGTPTPTGTFYLTELITPTNEGYGPFAYGISAFSEELTSFGGGPGQIGLHGTEDEDSLGTAVSHGCIRMSNAAITELSALLPLGTPIEIT